MHACMYVCMYMYLCMYVCMCFHIIKRCKELFYQITRIYCVQNIVYKEVYTQGTGDMGLDTYSTCLVISRRQNKRSK